MTKKAVTTIVVLFFIPLAEYAQQKDPVTSKADTIVAMLYGNETKSDGKRENLKITCNNYFSLLSGDIKKEFGKVFNMRRKDWRNFAVFAAMYGVLISIDEPIQKYAVTLMRNNPAIENTSAQVTKFGGAYERYMLVTLAAWGFTFKNPKLVNTALLATQAYITGSAIEVVLKILSGKTRPNYYTASEEAEPKFIGPFARLGRDAMGKKRYSSFPSGHTIIAFGAASVFCEQYQDIKCLPIFAYGAATLVGLSRITENRHWLTDVLTGAAIGFLNGKAVVNNYRHYSKIKKSKLKSDCISYSFSFVNRQVVPRIIYTFK